MARRGRPPYPDLLTPREAEVLSLIREGLTNGEIAERLGISLDGAKYHVSEILSKLGLSRREEAAAWKADRTAAWMLLAGLLPSFSRLRYRFGWRVLAATAAVAAGGVALGLLATGVLVMQGRTGNHGPGPSRIAAAVGPETLDWLIPTAAIPAGFRPSTRRPAGGPLATIPASLVQVYADAQPDYIVFSLILTDSPDTAFRYLENQSTWLRQMPISTFELVRDYKLDLTRPESTRPLTCRQGFDPGDPDSCAFTEMTPPSLGDSSRLYETHFIEGRVVDGMTSLLLLFADRLVNASIYVSGTDSQDTARLAEDLARALDRKIQSAFPR